MDINKVWELKKSLPNKYKAEAMEKAKQCIFEETMKKGTEKLHEAAQNPEKVLRDVVKEVKNEFEAHQVKKN